MFIVPLWELQVRGYYDGTLMLRRQELPRTQLVLNGPHTSLNGTVAIAVQRPMRPPVEFGCVKSNVEASQVTIIINNLYLMLMIVGLR